MVFCGDSGSWALEGGMGNFLLICGKLFFYCSLTHILHFWMGVCCFLFPQKLVFCGNTLHLQSVIKNSNFYSTAAAQSAELWWVLPGPFGMIPFPILHVPHPSQAAPSPSCPYHLLDNTTTRKVLKFCSCSKWTHGFQNPFQLWKWHYLRFMTCDVRGKMWSKLIFNVKY